VAGKVRIGISGWRYEPWRGVYYPKGLAQHRELWYSSRQLPTIEINGTFYSLQRPECFQSWYEDTPDDFVFAVKGGRFITHNLKLRNCEGALGNFFASGVLALGAKTGPFLWQLPTSYQFDADRMEAFMRMLPRTSTEGEAVARDHDHRLRRGALVESPASVTYRHAFEVRHPSYFHDEFYQILRDHRCAFVIADSAGTFGYAEEVTADFVYVRLHGSQALYASDYTDDELSMWAKQTTGWLASGHDVYVYFDNDAHVHAPYNAIWLESLVNDRCGPAE